MLRIIKNADSSTVYSIDALFDSLPLSNHWDIINTVVNMNGFVLINERSDFTAETPVADIRMRHEFWGSSSLTNLPTGLKALALAAFAVQESRPFSCFEFCIGSNILPKFVELAADTDLIAVVAPELQLSCVSADMKSYKVMIDGQEGEIFC